MSGPAGARQQVNRLLALVPYLQGRGEISVAEAAEEFGVSPATIRRDIGVLMFCGLPGLGMGDLIEVDFDALEGADVIRLSNADYLARPLRLDSTEAAALVVGLRTLLDSPTTAEREVVERTLHKIEAATGEASGLAHQVELHVVEDHTSQQVASTLADALSQRRQVRISHTSSVRDEITTRVVDPVALSTSAGHSYLDAWCHSSQDRRLFRVDRITEAVALEEPVTARASARPRDLSKGLFKPSPDAQAAVLDLSPSARWVAEYFPVESSTEQPDGCLRVVLLFDDPTWLVRLMLRLGGSATIREPATLATEVTAAAEHALSNYS